MTMLQPVTKQWRKQPRWRTNFCIGVVIGLIFGSVALLVVIGIWIALRQSPVEIPELAGLSRVKAEETLQAMGLTVRTTLDETSEQPTGTVLRTDPAAGEELSQGAGVSLVLAMPAPPATIPGIAENPLPAVESPAPQEPPAVVVSPPAVVSPPVVSSSVAVLPPTPRSRPGYHNGGHGGDYGNKRVDRGGGSYRGDGPDHGHRSGHGSRSSQ
jgi:hypothetical protein